ncbi:MAG: hypothetical protein KDA89_19795 [Planctomycetaceae bacterium]|nr:hypothetical protein [Planctomycetaceae bacterium]
MSRILLTLAFLSITSTDLTAQVTQFPYQAEVVVSQTYVRSGGGEAFYPTSQLSKGSVVTVHRHDPGGWYMIEPPEGSFSWIPEKFVQRMSGDEGEVLESDVVVFVGSSFGDETSVWQRRMMSGEKVRILDSRHIDTVSGPKAMLKIAPPAREYRWVPGSAVVPVGDAARMQHDRNPYAIPSNVVRSDTSGVTDAPRPNGPSSVAGSAGKGPAGTGPADSGYQPSAQLAHLQQLREEQRRLHDLDQRFRTMIFGTPDTWDLESIESAYRSLQDTAANRSVASQIDLRYPAIARYRQRKAEYEDFKRLTSETERRDAELLAVQFGSSAPPDMSSLVPPQVAVNDSINGAYTDVQTGETFFPPGIPANGTNAVAAVPETMLGAPVGNSVTLNGDSLPGNGDTFPFSGDPLTAPRGQVSQMSGITDPSVVPGISLAAGGVDFTPPLSSPAGSKDVLIGSAAPLPTAASATATSATDDVASRIPPNSRFIGAGIVRRTAPGESGDYLLTTASGRVLAKLKPESADVNFEQHVGQSVGLQGTRWFDETAGHDVIEVSGVEPVRLKQ